MEKSTSHTSTSCSGSDDRYLTDWIDIQKSTFTNWVNTILAPQHVTVTDLYKDIRDGVILVKLYETVSGKKINHAFNSPKVLPHRLENVSLVMKAMNKDGVKFVNIEPLDICDGNPKLILALIWHLILYYQIGIPQIPSISTSLEGSRSQSTLSKIALDSSVSHKVKEEHKSQTLSPKTLLIRLFNSLIPQTKISNLTTDWNDGTVLATLIQKLAPSACLPYESWNDKNHLLNVTTALCVAEVHLGIPVLVEPQHMVTKNVDELSMITYLSSFTKEGGVIEKHFVKTLAKKYPSIASELTNMTSDWSNGVLLCKLVKECHPGALKGGYFTDFSNLAPDSYTYQQNAFLNVKRAMQDAHLLLSIEPNIKPEIFVAKNVPALAIMSYLSGFINYQAPSFLGPPKTHDVILQLPIPDVDFFPESTICFSIQSVKNIIPIDFLKVKIYKTDDPGVKLRYTADWVHENECLVYFIPKEIGQYIISITLHGEHVKDSPLTFDVIDSRFESSPVFLENFEPNMCCLDGFSFIVHLKETIGVLSCVIEDTKTRRRYIAETLPMPNRSYKVSLNNQNLVGNYELILKDDETRRELHRGRFTCIDPTERIKLVTPKVITIAIGEPVNIQIETTPDIMTELQLRIRPENSIDINCNIKHSVKIHDKQNIWEAFITKFDKSFNTYIAELYWREKLLSDKQIKINVINIEDIKIVDNFDKNILQINQQHEIRVFLPISIDLVNIEGWVEKMTKQHVFSRVYDLKFIALRDNEYMAGICLFSHGAYNIRLKVNGQEIKYPRSSLRALDATKVAYEILKFSGNTNDPIEVKVSVPREAGIGDLYYTVEGPNGPIDVDVKPINRNEIIETYLIGCVPQKPGEYKLILSFGGLDVQGFPKTIRVIEPKRVDVSSIKVEKDKLKFFIDDYANEFSIVVPKSSCRGSITGFYTSPGSKKQERTMLNILLVDENDETETYQCKVKPVGCDYIVLRLFYNDTELDASPFNIDVIHIDQIETDWDAKVLTVDEPHSFCIFVPFEDIKDFLKVSVIQPHGDILFPVLSVYQGSSKEYKQWLGRFGMIYSIEFDVKEAGEYVVHVSLFNHPIPGFPKVIEAQRYEAKYQNITIKTPQQEEFRVGDLCSIIIDTRKAEPGKLDAAVTDPNGQPIIFEITPIYTKHESKFGDEPRIYKLDFNLQEHGETKVVLFWNDKMLKDEPMLFRAVSLLPDVSVSNNVVIDGFVGEPFSVSIDNVDDHIGFMDCACYDPSGKKTAITIEPSETVDGASNVIINPEEPGMHKIELKIFEKHISGSPFYFNASYPINAKKIKAYGDGLMSGVIKEHKGTFYLHTDKAGSGLLHIDIQGPKDGFKLNIQYVEENDYGESPAVIADYQPRISGLYVINVLWSGEHVPGSPFNVYNCDSKTDLNDIFNGNIPLNYKPFRLADMDRS